MNVTMIAIFFLFGLIFGSFFNVIGLRVPENKPFANDRSACPHCGHTLAWYELIPVLSYIFQLGKCKHCYTKISFLYPAIEVLTGFLFMFSFMKFGFDMELVIALLLVSMLVILLVTDITYMLIPNKILLFFLPLFVFMRVIVPLDPWWSPIVGASIGFVIIMVVILVSRGGMGAGDMKLFTVLGVVLGTENILLAFFLSCMIGAVIGVVLLVVGAIDRKQPVPFGPYIVVATLVTYFYGDLLRNWYVTTFLI
ncbi:prepilin peptidase [Oceanobacillus halotolerans]|uniref:prepilin peptidase n=1 Tax=Oceanobacillus halotolerans TaxID=2663380 RepID=UPI0013D96BB6|nr:A24 family peptidase [Oceanobacillus halotolerans]